MSYPMAFLFAHGGPVCSGSFRVNNEDFIVTEGLGWEPEGHGEHVYIELTKNGDNTAWVAKHLAQHAGVKDSDVGYCGLKDRRAITRQWFSVYLPKGESPDWKALEASTELNITIHNLSRGTKKLRRGQHEYNEFVITLRDLQLAEGADLNALMERIQQVGVPNYFGEQRFGINGNNLALVEAWLDRGEPVVKRHNKHLLISSARSYLFNRVLSLRVKNNNWFTPIDGDVCPDGVVTGPLWGRGRSATQVDAAELEARALSDLARWCNGLEHVGLQQERRHLALIPLNLQWQRLDDRLLLTFRLPPGQYATSVLREIAELKTAERND